MEMLEQAIAVYLQRTVTPKTASMCVRRMAEFCEGDWNEVRVSSLSEIADCLRLHPTSVGPRPPRLEMARGLREGLCRLFNAVHTLDLAFLQEDVKRARKLAKLGMLPLLEEEEWAGLLRKVG